MQTIALLAVIFLLLCAVGYLLRVNERLTDKVMAKDYREYKTLDKPVETIEQPKRKPMSWADDVDFDDEDDKDKLQ